MPAPCWKGILLGWVSKGLTLCDTMLSPGQLCLGWGCAAMARPCQYWRQNVRFRLARFFAYQLHIRAPALLKSVGVWQTSKYQRRGSLGEWSSASQTGVTSGSMWKARWVLSRPVHPSCPRGNGERIGSAEQGYFHLPQEHYLTV